MAVETAADFEPTILSALTRQGYRVIVVHSLDDAYQTLARFSIDLLILPVRTPEGSGLDLARIADALNPAPKALFLIDIHESLPSGVDVLQRPVTADQLIKRVQRLLGK